MKLCALAGVRCQESPARAMGLTTYAAYKDITWGNKVDKKEGHYAFYPIYDWTLQDVWKAIHDNAWPYCHLYDLMYQYGIPLNRMRVSNVHHETAVHSLKFLQEIEPDTWNKITARVSGVNAVNLAGEAYQVPAELPPMFGSWVEYRDYLVDNLITPEFKPVFMKRFGFEDNRFDPSIATELNKAQIAAVLLNDHEGLKMNTWTAAHGRYLKGAGGFRKHAPESR